MQTLKGPTFGILCKPSIRPTESYAAQRAMDRFARSARYDVRQASEATVRKVRVGAHLLEALRSNGPVQIDSVQFLMSGGDPLSSDSIWERTGRIGIALTDKQIFVLTNTGMESKPQEVLSASRYRRGGLVTVSGLRKAFGFDARTGRYKEERLAMRAVELAVLHAVGHVLIEREGWTGRGVMGESHCTGRSCLMQETYGVDDFVERIVKAGLDFCVGCKHLIRMELTNLKQS